MVGLSSSNACSPPCTAYASHEINKATARPVFYAQPLLILFDCLVFLRNKRRVIVYHGSLETVKGPGAFRVKLPRKGAACSLTSRPRRQAGLNFPGDKMLAAALRNLLGSNATLGGLIVRLQLLML